MEYKKEEKLFELITLLSQGSGYTLEELAHLLHKSKRSIYRYIDFFHEPDFKLTETNGRYRLERTSCFFQQISEFQNFTLEECITLKMALEKWPGQNKEIKKLSNKISHLYNLDAIQSVTTNRFFKNQESLIQAAEGKFQVILKNYQSSNSNNWSDRLIEPFDFLSGKTEVRAFEISSQTNKTYKISRIEDVIVLPVYWEHALYHKKSFTDAFHFSGEELFPVRLRLDKLAVNLLQEEIIVRPGELKQENSEHWVYQTQICQYRGIGRFIMGLLGHIQILDNRELKAFVRQEVQNGIKGL